MNAIGQIPMHLQNCKNAVNFMSKLFIKVGVLTDYATNPIKLHFGMKIEKGELYLLVANQMRQIVREAKPFV